MSPLSETDGGASTASSRQRPVPNGASAALCVHMTALLFPSPEEEGTRKLDLTFLFFLTALHALKQGGSEIDKVAWLGRHCVNSLFYLAVRHCHFTLPQSLGFPQCFA